MAEPARKGGAGEGPGEELFDDALLKKLKEEGNPDKLLMFDLCKVSIVILPSFSLSIVCFLCGATSD